MRLLNLAFCVGLLVPGFVAPQQAAASQENRLFEACRHLFKPVENPFFFRLERDGETALLFGTNSNGVALEQFPPFIIEAIETSKVVAVFGPSAELTQQEVSQAAQSPSQARAVAEEPTDLEPKLQPGAAALFRQYLAMVNFPPEKIAGMTPEIAIQLLMKIFSHLTNPASEKEIARAVELDRIRKDLDPPATEEESAELFEKLNLEYEVGRLAVKSGAKPIGLINRELQNKLTEKGESYAIEALEQLLIEMDKVVRSGYKSPLYASATVEDLNEAAGARAKILPSAAMRDMVLTRLLVQVIEQTIHQNEGVLLNLPYHFLGGRSGLLQGLKNAGFRVEQITTEERWLQLKGTP